MAYQVFNITRSQLCSSISFPCRNPLIRPTFNRGTADCSFYPICYPHLCLSRKKSEAPCLSNQLTGSEKGLNAPPSSKEEAIQQVRECLSNLLEKPLKNLATSVKHKRYRQARFTVEIPIIDDSPSALTSLVVDTLLGFSVKRKGLPTKFAIVWPNSSQIDLACQLFENADFVKNLDVSRQDKELVEDSDVLFFVAPEVSQLPFIESISTASAPRPVVLFNPNWSFEDESNASGFLSSFEAVYSFTPLTIQGFFSKTEGAIFKYVKSGTPSSNPWLIFVKEKGQYRCVSRFKRRPDASELETVLYNLIARNSPLIKSMKFLRSLVSRP